MLPVAGLALALAFYKINNRPFIIIMEAAIKYWINRKLYTWKREEKKLGGKASSSTLPTSSSVAIPRLSDSKLSDLAWSLDVQERVK